MTGMIDSVKRRFASAVLRGALAASALMLISICIAAAIAFALLAAYFYLHLSMQMPSAVAAAVTGGIALVLAALIGILAFRIASRPRRAVEGATPDRRTSAAGSSSLNAAVDEAASWIAKNPRAAVIAAFTTGSVFGLSPQLRKAAADLIVAAVRPPPPRDR